MTFTIAGIGKDDDLTLPIRDGVWRIPNGIPACQKDGIFDLIGDDANRTADPYSDQLGPNTYFQSFASLKPDAMNSTPGQQLAWIDLL
jgi:hypothetical protein